MSASNGLTWILLQVLLLLSSFMRGVDGQADLGSRYLFLSGGKYTAYEPNFPSVSFDRLLPVCSTFATLFRTGGSNPFPIMQFTASGFLLSCFSFEVRTLAPSFSCPLQPSDYVLTVSLVDAVSSEVLLNNEPFVNITSGGSLMQALLRYDVSERPSLVYTVHYSQVSGRRCPAYVLVSRDVSTSVVLTQNVPLLVSSSLAMVEAGVPVELSFMHWSQEAIAVDGAPALSRATCSAAVAQGSRDAAVIAIADPAAAARNRSRWLVTPLRQEFYSICYGSNLVGTLRVVGGSPAYFTNTSNVYGVFALTFHGAWLDATKDSARVIPVSTYATCDNVTSFFPTTTMIQSGLRTSSLARATQMDLTIFSSVVPSLYLCYKASGGVWRRIEYFMNFDEKTSDWLRLNASAPTTFAPSTIQPPPSTATPPGLTLIPTTRHPEVISPAPSQNCPTASLGVISSFSGVSLQVSFLGRSTASLIKWIADYFCLRASSVLLLSQMSRNGISTIVITVQCAGDPGCFSPQAEMATINQLFSTQPAVFMQNGIMTITVNSDPAGTTGGGASLDLFFTIFSLACVGAIVIFCCICCYCWCRRRRVQIITDGLPTVERVDSSDFENDTNVVQARVAGGEPEAVVGMVMNPVPPPVPDFVQAGGGYYYTDPVQEPQPQCQQPACSRTAIAEEESNAFPDKEEEMVEMPKADK